MRLFIIPALFTALSMAGFAYAETGEKEVTLTVQGALVSVPNTDITLELGKDISGLSATQTDDGTLTIRMSSLTAQSGFVIRGLPLTKFKVMFSQGEEKPMEIDPSVMGDHVYTYLPLTSATAGGMFTIILPDQPGFKKKKKAFLN